MGPRALAFAVRIRPATSSDIPAVLPMVRAICDHHQRHDPERFQVRPDVVERYAAWFPERIRDPRSVFLVAETDEPGEPARIVGYTVCTVEPEIPIFWVPECGWIHDIWIDPDFRRTGAAQTLVSAVVDRFREIGVKQIRLHTGAFNEPARALFESCGFRRSVVEMLRTLEPPAMPPPKI